jgi:hypothetical protein
LLLEAYEPPPHHGHQYNQFVTMLQREGRGTSLVGRALQNYTIKNKISPDI